MSFISWLRSSTSNGAPRNRPRHRPATAPFRPRLEALDDRLVPAQVSLTVSSLADAGAGSLRAAVLAADAGKPADRFTIGFSVTGTIDLRTPLPELNNSIAIRGPGAGSLTVERAAGTSFTSAIVTVDAGQTASLAGLTIANGNAGGIANNGGALTIAGCTLSGNTARIGGAISNSSGVLISDGSYTYYPGTLTVRDSQFVGNSAISGAAIYNGSLLTVRGSTFSGNTATLPDSSAGFGNYGGGLFNVGTATLQECGLSGNTAGDGGGGIFGSGRLTLKDSTVTGNAAPAGADLFIFFGAVTLDDSTVGVIGP